MIKHGGTDKWEAHRPNVPNFIQDTHYASQEHERFHIPIGYGYRTEKSNQGFSFGINKRLPRASSHGDSVDGYYVGKSDL